MNVYVMQIARQLARRGVQVDVFARRHDPADPQVVHLADGARLIHLNAGPLSTEKQGVYDFLPDFTLAVEAYRRSEGAAYDLIASHYWLSGLVGIDLAATWRVPHVASFHTLAEVKRRARPGEQESVHRASSEQLIAARADRTVVWSEHEKRALAEFYGADPSRASVIPPGVDTERFAPLDQADSRHQLGIDGGRLILYVGRLERLKGLDILMRAVAALDDVPDARLMIVGGSSTDPETRRLRALVRDLKIETRVDFLGAVDQSRLPLYYSAADICVLPSYYESFGLAALEAAACGRPVVASNVGGLPSVVQDGLTGYLIGWRCPGPFVNCLEMLLENPHLRRSLGAAAREHARTLTWDASAERLLRLYRSITPAGRRLMETAPGGD